MQPSEVTLSGFPASASAEPLPVQSMAQLVAVLELQRHHPVISLRQALEQMGYVNAATLDRIQAEDAEYLRSQSGELVRRMLLTAEDLEHALARMAGIPEVDTVRFAVPPDAFQVLRVREARLNDVVPLGAAEDRFFIASYTPTDESLRRRLCELTGRSVSLVWASRAAIRSRLDLQESAGAAAAANARNLPPLSMPGYARGATGPAATGEADIELLVSQALIEIASGQEHEEAASAAESSGMVRMVKKMIDDALAQEASDIHIETNPGEQITLIRFRRDGDLEPYLHLPARLRSSLVSRIKIMARLDIAERRRPQDGKINYADFGGPKLELRVAVMPTHDGLEDVVLRLLATTKPIPLAKLGLQPRDEDTFKRLSGHTFGLILAAGPTGSGKTTTLHSMLAEVNTGERKIWTAEDPIEITQPGLRQVQVNPKIGVTFAAAMRGFLRADPDIIMIGEIRDQETAKIAIEASLTGHLVLSTLHTNSASESVVRLLDLGMDPMNFADSLVGIVAQRLVRALCPHCAVPHRLGPGQFERLLAEYIERSSLSPAEGQRRLLAAAGVESPEQILVHTAAGCEKCSGKGYKGRMGIYEILENNPAIRELIQRHARPTELFEAAIASGMRSLRHDALEKLVQGKVDVKQARLSYV
jgi:type II secretory ATPase GspE/PulE/Tfp pilus assembly ATPase PilB-like protein